VKTILKILAIVCFAIPIYSQSAQGTDSKSDVPKVFLISEDDQAYGDLVSSTPNLLLQVCNNSMEEAYKKWVYMLADIEDSAEAKGFDIKGLKIWINVFWNMDGTIEHIVYYPKPNSKNIEYSEFTNFLNDFSKDYQLDIKSSSNFVHYGSASFPTFVDQMFPERSH
jgi:hypothetical protein